MLTLREAIATDRLQDFAAQAEAEGVGPAPAGAFDALLSRIIKAPPPTDRTSHSPAKWLYALGVR